MSGLIQGSSSITTLTNNNKHHSPDSKSILDDLLNIVKECQTRYGGKTELATEHDSRIANLCSIWECTFSHGLKTNSSVLKNVTDLMSGSPSEPPSFWEFAYHHLTAHEKERFNTLRHVWTDRGKGRALIRAALNERSLERYILIWLNEPQLMKQCYETWALLRDDEATNLLPSIAAGLGSILFAITIDNPDMNVMQHIKHNRTEPIIVAPHPTGRSQFTVKKTQSTAKHQIISFEDQEISVPSIPTNIADSAAAKKSLSSMCLKYEDQSKELMLSRQRSEIEAVLKVENIPEPLDNYCEPESSSSVHIYEAPVDPTAHHPQCSSDSDNLIIEHGSGILYSFASGTPNTSTISDSSSSLQSSLGSVKSSEDIAILKEQLRDTFARCVLLEDQIGALTVENHRLRSMNTRHGFNYFSVSVPRVLLQRINGRGKYYAYEVHIIPTHGGDEWTILRRYSDFYKLHKKYQKDNMAVKTLDFPPKKQFGNMDAHFVEQRRQRLQVYLRHLLAILPDVAACTTRSQLEQVFPFFK